MNAKKALTVSIVIPVYNEERHLKACLDAIKVQTLQPTEIIVVDNNCTDHSLVIAKRYRGVRIVAEKRQGIAWARNRGFNAARGDIIARIDADTVLPPDWLERIMAFYALPANDDTAITGGCTFYNVRWPRVDQWVTSQFVFRMNRLVAGHYLLWGSNMALPRRLWLTVKKEVCTRNDIHEDLDLSLHLHRHGFRIHYQANLIVGARMPHVFDQSEKVWPYMQMWPRTLQTHGLKRWPISYGGAVFLWGAQWFPRLLERISVAAGKAPLN